MTTIELAQRDSPRAGRARVRCVRARWTWLWLIASASVACGSNPSTDSTSTASAGSSATDDPGWCAVQPILALKCQRCHLSPPKNGAPFSLLEYADTQEPDSKGKARYERMASVIESGYMPPQFIALTPPVEALTADERATLLAWCSLGAPAGETSSCATDP